MSDPQDFKTMDRRSFWGRVNYAEAGIVRGEDSRALDDCFEMYDGAYVVRALMLRQSYRPALREGIARMFRHMPFEEIPWHETSRKLGHLGPRSLARCAAEHRKAERRRDAHAHQRSLFDGETA